MTATVFEEPHVFEFLLGTITSSLPQLLPVELFIVCH